MAETEQERPVVTEFKTLLDAMHQRKRAYLSARIRGKDHDDACRAADVSPATVASNWTSRDKDAPAFCRCVDIIEQHPEVVFELQSEMLKRATRRRILEEVEEGYTDRRTGKAGQPRSDVLRLAAEMTKQVGAEMESPASRTIQLMGQHMVSLAQSVAQQLQQLSYTQDTNGNMIIDMPETLDDDALQEMRESHS